MRTPPGGAADPGRDALAETRSFPQQPDPSPGGKASWESPAATVSAFLGRRRGWMWGREADGSQTSR